MYKFWMVFLQMFDIRYILTGIYILAIQYLTKIGGQVAMTLTKSQQLGNKEAVANSLIYKVSPFFSIKLKSI